MNDASKVFPYALRMHTEQQAEEGMRTVTEQLKANPHNIDVHSVCSMCGARVHYLDTEIRHGFPFCPLFMESNGPLDYIQRSTRIELTRNGASYKTKAKRS